MYICINVRYFELLDSSTPGPVASKVTSSYLPENTRVAGLPEQIIIVERQVYIHNIV